MPCPPQVIRFPAPRTLPHGSASPGPKALRLTPAWRRSLGRVHHRPRRLVRQAHRRRSPPATHSREFHVAAGNRYAGARRARPSRQTRRSRRIATEASRGGCAVRRGRTQRDDTGCDRADDRPLSHRHHDRDWQGTSATPRYRRMGRDDVAVRGGATRAHAVACRASRERGGLAGSSHAHVARKPLGNEGDATLSRYWPLMATLMATERSGPTEGYSPDLARRLAEPRCHLQVVARPQPICARLSFCSRTRYGRGFARSLLVGASRTSRPTPAVARPFSATPTRARTACARHPRPPERASC